MVYLKDVAKKCNCSIATVSKALNDHSDIGYKKRQRYYKLLLRWDMCKLLFRNISKMSKVLE